MSAIGITGGIATGKSAFVAALREFAHGTFFDADAAARDLSQNDAEVRELIAREFGPDAYGLTGDLNRAHIRAIVFGDADKRRALEQILHPRIRDHWRREAEAHRNSKEFFFADIPLLYETGGETLCDFVVAVACSREVQLERLMKRMSISQAEGEAIIAAQMPLEQKMRRADHVVWNNGPREVLREQARLLAGLWQK